MGSWRRGPRPLPPTSWRGPQTRQRPAGSMATTCRRRRTYGGEDALMHVEQQHVGTEGERADAAQPPPQEQQQPEPYDGVGGVDSLGAVKPGAGGMGRGGVEEERLALGAEQGRPTCPEGSEADSATSEGERANGGPAAPCAIDDPDWYADTPVNRFLDSIMAHQEGIKAAAEADKAGLLQQLGREREQAEAPEARAAAAEALLRQLQGAGANAEQRTGHGAAAQQ